MATRTRVTLSCDLCGNSEDVQTWTFGLDGKAYEIDLCLEDGKGLREVAAGYRPKARKVTAVQSPRRHGRKPRPETAAISDRARAPGRNASGQDGPAGSAEEARASGPGQQAAPAGRAKAKASSRQEARTSGPSQRPAPASGARQEKGIYVYAILPADIEVAGEMWGVGEPPGLLRVICADGVAALVSEVDLSGRLGSPVDRRTHREIVDATATEVPVLPLRFGTVVASEDQVTGELLAAHHDEFAAALQQLEGRVQFTVVGRYLEQAVLDEVASHSPHAARLQDAIGGQDADAARQARAEFDEIINEAVTARRRRDTRVLEQAMDEICVASMVREPARELDAVHVALLVDAGRESELKQVIGKLARDWEGRIEVRLLGPMAARDFVTTAAPDG